MSGLFGLLMFAFWVLAAISLVPRYGRRVLDRVGWRHVPLVGGLSGVAAAVVLFVATIPLALVGSQFTPPSPSPTAGRSGNAAATVAARSIPPPTPVPSVTAAPNAAAASTPAAPTAGQPGPLTTAEPQPVATTAPTPTNAPTAVPTIAPTPVPTPVPTTPPTVPPAAAPPPTAPPPTAVPVFGIAITSSRYGLVAASTVAGASCTAKAKLPSGNFSSAQGLAPTKIADSNGGVSWSYGTVSSTTPGTGTYTVTCIWEVQTASSSAPFSVP